MAKKKSFLAEDRPLYTGWNIACPFQTGGRKIRPLNASVRCTDEGKNGWPAHCMSCGWNPDVQREGLTKMVGAKQADILMEQSKRLAEKNRAKINAGEYKYV